MLAFLTTNPAFAMYRPLVIWTGTLPPGPVQLTDCNR